MQKKTNEDLMAEVEELRAQLEEAQETLDAIRRGEVDGLVVSTPKGEQVYTISGAERPYRALIEDMREGAVMLSDDNTVLYCNTGFAKMMRRSAEKIVGVKIESMVGQTNIPVLTELLTLSRAHKGALAKEVTLQAGDEILVPTLMSVNSLQSDTIKNTFLVVTDLSEHMSEEVKRYTQELEIAQIALSESEQRWATTLASIGDAVIATNELGNIKFMNKAAEKITGWTLNEASKKPVQEIFKIVNEFSRKTVDDPVSKVLKKGLIVGLANHTILIRKDKSEVAIDDSGAPIKDKVGKTTGVVLIFRDITERRKAEEKLQKYQKNLEKLVEERTKKLELSSLYARNLIEASLDPLVTISIEGKITDVNKATEQATGRSREELIGSDFSDYFVDPGKAKMSYKRVFAEGIVKDYPLEIKHRNGKTISVLYNATVYRNNAGEIQGVFAAARDITDLRKAELEAQESAVKLKDSERLAAIGTTAGMVGHDIRNPLQAITGDVFLAKSELASTPESKERNSIQESLTEIEKNVDYINKIVQDLQDYARPLNPNPKEADIKLIIEKMLQKNGIPENVKVRVKVEDEARKFVADTDYLNRIFYNLVTNAVQAMPNGGKLNISVYKEETNIVIEVKDTGVGIPKDIQSKMFTPMFTTKAKGQGFGLPVVKRMTESLGGTVSFESQEGNGTTFTIRIPTERK